MKLFENKVGRPSNEMLRKRKIFKLSIVLGIIFLLCVCFLLGYFNIINLRGYAKGSEVTLCKDTRIYITADSKIYYKSSGKYYIWSSFISNGRIKITKKEKYAGKTGLAVGWVDTSSLTSCSKTSSNYKSGDVNMDGKVSGTDSRLILQHVVGLSKLNEGQLALADVNKDGKVTATDARLVLQIAVGLNVESENENDRPAITMTEFSKTWNVGDSKTATVTLKDSSDSFEVDSSKPNVMKVSDKNSKGFKLTALGIGSSKITVKSKKTGQSVSYEYTVQNNANSSQGLTIAVSLDGELNSNGVYMYNTESQKKINLVLNNETGTRKYYKWFLYSGQLNSDGKVSSVEKPYHVSACYSYDKNTSTTQKSWLKNNASEGLKVITVRNYLNEADCKADGSATTSTFVNEKKVSFGLMSSLISVTIKPEGTANSDGIVPITEEKTYANNVTINNFTTKKIYYRWFTYNSHDTSKNPSYYKNVCTEINSTLTKNWNITMSSTYSNRAGKIKVYSTLSACNADNKSSSNSNVLTSKTVKYSLSKVYTNSNGFKMIRYDHEGLSKEVGTQLKDGCARAAWAHGAYILSNGKYVFKSKNIAYPILGATAVKSFDKTGVYNLIIAKIDRGIPVMIQGYNDNYSSHWVTVVGYKTGKSASKMSLSDIYIVDPWYSESKYNSFSVTLWRGVASNRQISFKGFHSDYMPRTWDNASDLEDAVKKNNLK